MGGFRRWAALGGAAVLAVGSLTACGSGSTPDAGTSSASSAGPTITLYSGRSKELVGPLIDQIKGAVSVNVAYDKKANQIQEEGSRSPADVYFGQDAGELGALAKAGLLEPLPSDIVDKIPAQYRSGDGTWAATSARSRVLVYNPAQLPEADLPTGIDGLLDPKFKGKVGYAPTNASFKSFVTALRVLRGEDGAKAWLQGFLANEPKKFEGNGKILDAVNSGTVASGLINHYYWAQAVQEKGEAGVPSKLTFFDNDPGGLVNLAGAAVLKSSTKKPQAIEFVRQLLTNSSQEYFATKTGEYPVVSGVPFSVPGLPPLSALTPPKVDYAQLADTKGTERLFTEVGAL
ncbi:Extracellular solute-binding protein family 1 OS=Tsukamurella paurometabola (strain ATCC 8368 / DSM / CCUG 35730 / CIP 100753 / JCM 10117 / KCTC 9821 /NBRC 16120 / NCIMB 702349 / NCTC 13040) OX=521096 GN=Tpau_2070 PE=3 SV=1 [Tsukamurella paurometabola]|uniref:Extracellular solute-binding protein family 1 n=1 Tax=Tsukamurella paurometabola (strain ATCC 8368 / DSM 20162 / CCUG 35730 / CIP 100753 / JCM 10117 / KCTC 9821 / NBRC 16120 / NCIMB 702349 / NCTC 13040) TaxID=521096 RepID=D5UNW4_TSUPD|nr:iron ABC transporter substrate-binding protein [Tsukamurella paurometabola]ADG78682.1 extracellular solute-binding protein family 1 [Tsukamurella paurometabola DSM 20162]SUP32716.1 Major iron-regulated protein [Tsukamurella paurometabola]